ncbi:unnamed protein product [Alopecurus aequalis]
MNEEGAELTRRRRLPAAQASPLEDDDLLWEILLRLPPQPSSLPRASAVCKRWLGLVTDPRFHRQFYAHHRKPPLLGGFSWSGRSVFNPVLDTPDRIPPTRLSLGRCSNRNQFYVLNCRHGLVLVHDYVRDEVVVCDPITGEQRHVAIPPDLSRPVLGGAVLCAASDLGHVHGGCHSSPFKVVLVSAGESDTGDLGCIYSSDTGVWGNRISADGPCDLSDLHATLVGNALYWLCDGEQILEFDLDGPSLTLITAPPGIDDIHSGNHHIIQGEDGDVGLATLSCPRLQTWQRKVNCHGVATWVPWKTIEMHTILGLPSSIDGLFGRLLGYDEDNGAILIYAKDGVYTVQLISMQSKKLSETHNINGCHIFTSFYAPGEGMAAALLTESVAMHQCGRSAVFISY